MPAGLKLPLFEDLDIVGGGYRDNAQCLVCGSMDRERLVYLYLKQRTSIFRIGGRVLHIAPEPLLMKSLQKQRNIQYIRANISQSRADVSFDVTQIPFKSDSFDLIIMNHVLEHVHDDKKAMSEILRVLKPKKGFCILQVPIGNALSQTIYDPSVSSDEERLSRYGQEDHVRLYGQDYPDLLSKAGFKADVFDWRSDKAKFSKYNKYGLIEGEKLFVGYK
ncbi:methyltransferase domain-containing protein [Paraglaciecola sp.]|uniref:class I SAM-dependent methyltransferase n=1 Tax=Paraglaciecola sp. TaxID=1920173 RepID=UPI003267BAC9